MPSSCPLALQPYTVVLDALGCAAVVVDRAGQLAFANLKLAEMMKRDRGELMGKSVFDLYDRDDEREQIRDALAHFEEPREHEFVLPLPDGHRLPVIITARQLATEGPLAGYRVVTMIDVAKQKLAEKSIREQFDFLSQMSDTVIAQALDLKDYNRTLEAAVQKRTEQLRQANMDAIVMLAVASEAKDHDTGAHVRRIEHYSRLLARELGLSEYEADEIGYSSILHDVGKIHIPDAILNKPGPLTDDERDVIQSHTWIGERILPPKSFFTKARRIARFHHENWDGSGYPDNRAGEGIPLEARIVHVADVWDALTTGRVYKEPWSLEASRAHIEDGAEKMFDPDVVKAFASLRNRELFVPPKENGNGENGDHH